MVKPKKNKYSSSIRVLILFIFMGGCSLLSHYTVLLKSKQVQYVSFTEVTESDESKMMLSMTYPIKNNEARAYIVATLIRGDEWQSPVGPHKLAVLNALRSLVHVFQRNKVMILVDDWNSCLSRPSFLEDCLCFSVSECREATFHMLTMDCIFQEILLEAEKSESNFVGFVNGDILVFPDSFESFARCASSFDRFFMVGKRHKTLRPPEFENYSVDIERLKRLATSAPLDGGYAIDYFFTPRAVLKEILEGYPAFIVGTQRWDNVLLANALKSQTIHVIDCTIAPILHMVSNPIENHGERPAAVYNEKLAKTFSFEDYYFGSIDNADFVLQRRQNGSFFFKRPTLENRVRSCAFRDGRLFTDQYMPSSVKVWLKEFVVGGPKGVSMVAKFPEHLRDEISLRAENAKTKVEFEVEDFLIMAHHFRRSTAHPGELYVYYDASTQMFFIKTDRQLSSSCNV